MRLIDSSLHIQHSSHRVATSLSPSFMRIPLEGRNKRGRVATPNSFSIFDSFDMKSMGMVSSLASKWEGLNVGVPVFQLFYEIELKTFKIKHFQASEDIMTKFKNCKLFMSQESNTEKLVGVATLPLSFLPYRTQAFYFINRPPGPNILTASVFTSKSQYSSIFVKKLLNLINFLFCSRISACEDCTRKTFS